MRVLLAAMGGNRGGVETKIAFLAPALAGRGHDVRVLFLRPTPDIDALLAAQGIPFTSLPTPPEGLTRSDFERRMSDLDELVAHPTPDVVIAFSCTPIMRMLNAATRASPDSARVAALVGERDHPWLTPTGMHPDFLATLESAHAVTAISAHLVDQVARGGFGDPSRIAVIANSVDLPLLLADVVVQPASAVVVANFYPAKGYRLLIDALRQVRVPVHIRVCGQGPLESSVRAEAAALPGPAHLTLVDAPADVPAELLAAQFAIHPSRHEGAPNAVLEEMAAGLPVVGFAIGGNRSLVEHGVSGVLVEPFDTQALALAIEQVATSPQVRARLGAEARLRAAQFSRDRQVAAFEELISAAVAARSSEAVRRE